MTQDYEKVPAIPVSKRKSSVVCTETGLASNVRDLVNEVPVAIVFNGSTAAVMMASPVDITEFALGFALTEGYISTVDEVESFEFISYDKGVEARFWVKDVVEAKIADRKRTALGPMGCGLCGIDSLTQALRPLSKVGQGPAFAAGEISHASEALKAFQPLHDQTRSAHAAGFIIPKHGVLFAKEDVGRHNALDKLCGTLTSKEIDPQSGAIIMTSRLSVDLVQKAATINCSILIGVSAPSSLAVEVAESVGMTLIAFCRASRFEIFTGAHRIST
jgi:FdhD protein